MTANMLRGGLLALSIVWVVPAHAQSNVEGRVGKLESEMRAVQRKVFPGAGQTILQPDIAAAQTPPSDIGTPATAPIADLTARVASLEQQIATLTGQVEQNGYKTRQLQYALDVYKRQTDARLKAMEGGATTASTGASVGTNGPTMVDEAADVSDRPTRAASTRPAADPERAAQSAIVERPSTGDAPEDEYLYGYRLWQARKYPQAEAQLKRVVAEYPRHRRASYAQNLLGRAYLDEGKPSLASIAFYDNYKKMPEGERAADSLQYLAQALVKLNKPADACKVYGELTEVYGAKMSTAMRADVARGRAAAKCK